MNATTTSVEYTRITHEQAVEKRLDAAVIRQDVDDVYRAYHEETRQVWDLPTEGFWFVLDTPPGLGPDSQFVELETTYGRGAGPQQSGALWFRDEPHAGEDPLWRLGPFARWGVDEDEVVDARIMPENVHPATLAALEWFEFRHLPEHLQAVSEPFSALAHELVAQLHETSAGAELTTALRKLIEAKDCAVRAAIKVPKEA